jgi:2'-5' RNA ligase
VPDRNLPLIVTLQLNDEAQEFFNDLRKQNYPAHINYIDAHLTLFHNLPSSEAAIPLTLRAFAVNSPINLRVSMVKHIGNGVVYVIQSSALQRLHKKMQQQFKPWLISKDRQVLWPHVTIQNKVTEYKSKQLHQVLVAQFEPFVISAIGFQTWHYLKGRWAPVDTFPFTGV